MTAVLPISAEPAAIPREDARPGRWRRMPTKAKVGAILLGVFVLAGVIGPFVARTKPPSWIIVELVRRNVPPCTTRPELKFTIRPSSCSVAPFNTVSGTAVPK